MTTTSWSPDLRESIARWLGRTLTFEHVEAMIPERDPLRTWWAPEPRATAVSRLATLLCGGDDYLTLLALVQRARAIACPPRELEEQLSLELDAIALNIRSTVLTSDVQADTFLSYAHEDMERAAALRRLLGSQGVRVFRDVERIRPGESITTRLHQVMAMVDSAVVIVSRFSRDSEWVGRELQQLVARRESAGLTLLPVLVDDVPLPESIADLFTIDLRGYRGERDDDWAHPRLQPLIQRLRARPEVRTHIFDARTRAANRDSMKAEVERTRRILDDVFQVEESHVRYERFDGTMSGVVRRLSFVRGDSVAAILVNRRLGQVILIKQFRYPTLASGSGWTIEVVAGTLQADETPEAGIRREIEEETGYRAGELTRISTFFVSPGGSTERVFLFHAEVDDSNIVSASHGLPDDDEDIQVLAVPIDAAHTMIAEGEIADAKTIVGLQWLFAARHRGEQS